MGATVLGQLLPIGSVIHSMLSEAQFQGEMGSGWVLSDGRSVAGSRYATVTGAGTIPDVRGRFLRAKNNGGTVNPDGDLALGTLSADKLRAHTHTTSGFTADTSGATARIGVFSADAATSPSAQTFTTNSTGGNETAPFSATVNIFIRIN